QEEMSFGEVRIDLDGLLVGLQLCRHITDLFVEPPEIEFGLEAGWVELYFALVLGDCRAEVAPFLRERGEVEVCETNVGLQIDGGSNLAFGLRGIAALERDDAERVARRCHRRLQFECLLELSARLRHLAAVNEDLRGLVSN